MITDILINKLCCKNTAHEQNLYIAHIDSHKILVCCQVDDFAPTKEGSKLFMDKIREHFSAEFNALGVERNCGKYEHFNGTDVFKTCDYIMLECELYINCVLKSHRWSSPTHADPKRIILIWNNTVN